MARVRGGNRGNRQKVRRKEDSRSSYGRNSGPGKTKTGSSRDFVGAPVSFKIVPLIALALIAGIWIIYAPTGDFGFLSYDDSLYVSENMEVARGISGSGVAWAFTTDHAANWHPLTWLSHMLDVQLFGMRPEYHRFVNVLLHAVNSLLLFWLLLRTTGFWGRSAVVALLFAVHPLHVESVAWIAERKDVLSTLFWMLTVLAYVHYVRRPLIRRRAAVIVLFALGLMAKPMLVTLPLMLLLIDIWPLGRVAPAAGQGRMWLQLIREKIPLFALSAASGVVTIIAQSRGGAVQDFDLLPFSLRAANAAFSYVAYIAKMFWPSNLIAHYPYEPVSGRLAMASLMGVALVSVIAVRYARRHPYILVGWLWYLCALLPVIGLIQVGEQSRADRYTYVPLIGIFIIAAWVFPAFFKWSRPGRILLPAASAVIIVVLTVAARIQVQYWKSDITLWKRAVEVTPENYFARTNLGIALMERGDPVTAGIHLQEALRIKPYGAEAHNALGVALFRQGRWQEAMPYYLEALRIRPEFADALLNLGTVMAMQGKTDEAISHFRKSLAIAPDKAQVRYNLGLALASAGNYEEAAAQYHKALEIQPLFAEAHNELGNIFFRQGKLHEAVDHYVKSLQIRPDFANAHNNLGVIRMNQDQNDIAAFHFREALRLDPTSAEARRNLEIVIRKQRQ